jgi:hypothetical protein
MHRVLVIGLITLLLFTGALHYAPLWLFVLVVPMWLAWWLDSEERRIRAEAWERVREQLRLKK